VPRDIDVVALMAGVAFAGLGLMTLIGEATGVAGRWTWPLLLILVGVVGLVASRRWGPKG
jgi:amino acid transporter